MKKLVPIIKVILAILFLYNIGLFSLLKTIDKIDPSTMPPFKEDGGRGDIEYLNEKIRKADALGPNYGPELYFSDLADIKLKQKNNDFDRRTILMVNSSIQSLLSDFNTNVMSHHRKNSPKDYDAFMARLSLARDKSLSITDPNRAQESAEFDAKYGNLTYWLNLLLSILTWLGNFYLKNLPLALTLLWLWWYEDKKRLSINNPISFLICLILYPVVIIRVWRSSLRNGARIFAMNIEFKRRQADLFTMISDDELADIKRFAKSDFKLSDYRKYLENRDLVIRRSLIPVGIVALTLLFTPKVYSAVASDNFHSHLTEYQMPIKAPPNLIPDKSQVHDDILLSAVISNATPKIFFTPKLWKFILPPVPQDCGGFKTNPDPVPLAC